MSDVAEACARLIPVVYDVALGARSVTDVLRDFARICGVERASITTALPSGRKVIAASAGVDAAMIESYNREFYLFDMIVPQAGARPVAFIPGTSAAEAIYPGYQRSDFYHAWARPHGAHQVAFATGEAPGGAKASLLLVADSSERRFGRSEQLKALGLVAPHVFNMLRLADRLRALQAADASFLAMIERAPSGVVLLDDQGRVVHVTRQAREALASADGLALTAGGLRAADPAAQRRVAAAVAAALGRDPRGMETEGEPVVVPRPSGSHYVLQVIALPRWRDDAELRAVIGAGRDRAVMITLAEPSRAARPRQDTLRQAFGLTAAESGVALKVLEGVALRSIAADSGVGVATVRSHLLRVFAKTGVHRQAELVRLLSSLATELG